MVNGPFSATLGTEGKTRITEGKPKGNRRDEKKVTLVVRIKCKPSFAGAGPVSCSAPSALQTTPNASRTALECQEWQDRRA